MKRITLMLLFVVSAAAFLQAQAHGSFKGTVTKMRMTNCVSMERGFVAAMSGVAAQAAGTCPEFTVVGDRVVYVVVGRRAEEFMPLAENVEFLIRKNELVLFSDDEKAKSRFVVQEMMLRPEWEREEARKELAARIMDRSASYETRNSAPASMSSGNGR